VRAVAVARPLINQWGSTDQEHQATWPGDQLVARPSVIWTNAITIHAPTAHVWPWLVQLGQGRGRLYSYDWLEDFIGCDVHSTDRILPGLQTPLRVGERVSERLDMHHTPRWRCSRRRMPWCSATSRTLTPSWLPDMRAAPRRSYSSRSTRTRPGSSSAAVVTRCWLGCRAPVQFVMRHKMMFSLKQRPEGSLPSPSTIDGNQPQPSQSPERRDLALDGSGKNAPPGAPTRGALCHRELLAGP
jgi:hypothetical protein